MNALRPQIRCREIGEADLDGVADLLARGFYGRSRDYWLQGLRRQAAREVPQDYPRFGYMLDHEGVPVGVLLLIYSMRDAGGESAVHCNLSSWYVEPAFRNYAPMLTSLAQRRKEVSYFNMSPAHWTWPIIEAQGFRAYCKGLFLSFPALSRNGRDATVEIVSADATSIDGLPVADAELLMRHAAYGCTVSYAASRSGFPVRIRADADPARLDFTAGHANGLLPRHRRIRRLRRRDRPYAVVARQDCGAARCQWRCAGIDRLLYREARPQY